MVDLVTKIVSATVYPSCTTDEISTLETHHDTVKVKNNEKIRRKI